MLTHPSEVRRLLAELDFKPSRALGQNFLVDGNILREMLRLARVDKDDVVIEVGPGLGTLTEAMLAAGARVVAIEKDRRLAAFLRERLGGEQRFTLVEGDALEADLPARLAGATKFVSNLPYSVGSRILVELAQLQPPPKYAMVTVQKEVADRLAAKPRTPDYGVLSVLVQARYDVVVDKVVKPACFLPPPQVKSALVELFRLTEPRLDPASAAAFRRIVKGSFEHRRKQMATIFQKHLRLEPGRLAQAGIGAADRPERVTVDGWCELARLCRDDVSAASQHLASQD